MTVGDGQFSVSATVMVRYYLSSHLVTLAMITIDFVIHSWVFGFSSRNLIKGTVLKGES